MKIHNPYPHDAYDRRMIEQTERAELVYQYFEDEEVIEKERKETQLEIWRA